MKKEFTPIAMKCDQEQFDAIRPKLEKIDSHDISMNFYNYPYLTNNYDGKFSIGTHNKNLIRKNVEIHETWNEKLFLEACCIETEKTYSITKEQILSIDSPKMKELFPDVFSLPKEFMGWVKDVKYKNVLAFCKNGILIYGRNNNYVWVNSSNTPMRNEVEATDQEVFEALKNEAVKRGFLKGAYHTITNGSREIHIKSDDGYAYDSFCNKFLVNGWCIFENGRWAEIIPTMTIQQAEEKLNCKIV